MVKLQATDDPSAVWYFNTMKDCEKFLYVFKDHWCNARWNKPIEADSFPEVDSDDWDDLQKNPKKMAEDNLEWGFFLEKYMGAKRSREQEDFLRKMVENLT